MLPRRFVQLLLTLALVTAACGGASDLDEVVAAPAAPAEADEPSSERTIFADVNIAIHDVPLDEIVFDTFDGGQVPLTEASEELVASLLNAIRPLNEPNYVSGSAATYLSPDDLVLGYIADDGTAWAYPHRVMNFHEIVNTTLGDRPVAVTYCPLCGSGVVFDRRPNDLRHQGVLTFDNTSALYENDMVMVDAETHTYWWHVAGRGIVGNLTGTELLSLPSTTTTWATWLDTHPDSMVLGNDQGRGPAYEFDPFVDYATRVDEGNFRFPLGPDALLDERLSLSTRVIGFETGGEFVAVPVLANEPVAIQVSGAEPLVVFLDGAGGGSVFRSDGAFASGPDGFVDGDGIVWDLAGRGSDGQQLEPVASRTAFWFAWVSLTDGATRVVGPAGDIE